jgi:subtilase-type serine protease
MGHNRRIYHRRTSCSRFGLRVGCSLLALSLALGPVAAEDLPPLRSPSTAGLTASDFETPEYGSDWGLRAINASTAYARGFTGLGILVAVIDTGIDASHPEFRDLGNRGGSPIDPASADAYEWLPNSPAPFLIPSIADRDGHGTHVSGTIGAARDGVGMMGVAYESRILTLRGIVGNQDAKDYNDPDIQLIGRATQAIDYATQHGARVLNGSYGPNYPSPGTSGFPLLQTTPFYESDREQFAAIKRAADAGMLLVFSAGNNRERQPVVAANPSGAALYPYISPAHANSGVYQFLDRHDNAVDQSQIDFSSVSGSIVAVVNVDRDNTLESSSNMCGVAAAWCIAAPGTEIDSSVPGGGYASLTGTSMAAPHVSGAAAVLMQAFPFLTAAQIAQTMFTTATHLGDGPANAPNAVYGWGLLNLGKAVDGPGQFTSTWTVNTTSGGRAYYGRFANDIGGVGGLIKAGLGTLELAGHNTYAGSTIVAGGTLILAASGSLASPVAVQGSGTYANAGSTQSNVSNAGLLINTGVISGSLANAGLAVTSGTIAGGLINTGTLLASAGRLDGAIRNESGILAVSGPVSSSGPFANAGSATLAVTGSGRYSLAGPLTNAGTVVVARTASLSAPAGLGNAGLVASDGTLDTDLTNTGIARLSGQLNGALVNTGFLRFTGPLSGLTSLTNAGALDLGGNALSIPSLAGTADAVLGNGSLTVSGPATSTYAGAILETASPTRLTKDGTGTLSLTGLGRFSGPTLVQAGTLSLNGFWTSPVTVAALGTLRGTGTVAAPVTVAGSLRPGNSPGTLAVLGPVTFQPGSAFGLDIDGAGTGAGAGSYARLLALGPTGAVAADGTLVPVLRGITGNATNAFTPSLGQRFGVLAAQGGLTGSFSGLAQPQAGLAAGTRFDALYGSYGLDLVVTPAAYGDLAGLGLPQSGNARAVGAALDGARPMAGTRPDAARARLFDPLYAADPASLLGGLASLSGQSYGDALLADLAARRLVTDTIDRHLRGFGGGTAALSAGDPGQGPNRSALQVRGGAGVSDQPLAAGEGRLWADALSGFGARAGDRTATGADLDTGGLVLGVDRQLGTDALVGGAFSYLRETGTSRGAGFGLGRFAADSYGGTLYAAARLGPLWFRGTAGGSYLEGQVDRTVALGAASSRARGLTSGWDAGVSGFLGYALGTGLPVELVPEVGLSYESLSRGRVAERGGLANQVFAAAELDGARLLTGGRVASLALDGLPALRLEGRAYWAHELGDTAAIVHAALFGAPFAARTSALGRDGALLGLTVTGPVAEGVSVALSYTGDLRPAAATHVFSAGLQARW